MVRESYESNPPIKRSKQNRELRAIADLRDSEIVASDTRELPPNAWKFAVRGRFCTRQS